VCRYVDEANDLYFSSNIDNDSNPYDTNSTATANTTSRTSEYVAFPQAAAVDK
jgi:hypothetical protein